jgi:adenosylcobinamide amidohydrolase
MIVTLAVFALVVIIIINGTLSLAELALAVIIVTLARTAFALDTLFTLPLSSSSLSPHS